MKTRNELCETMGHAAKALRTFGQFSDDDFKATFGTTKKRAIENIARTLEDAARETEKDKAQG